MPNHPIVLDTPEAIQFARLATLKGMLKLEMKGLRRSRTPTAYSYLKRLGYKGSRSEVLEAVGLEVEQLIEQRAAARHAEAGSDA